MRLVCLDRYAIESLQYLLCVTSVVYHANSAIFNDFFLVFAFLPFVLFHAQPSLLLPDLI